MKVAGVVLAGGASSRMGRNKALLSCGDGTFLDELAVAMRAGGCRPVLAVVSGSAVEVERECRLRGVDLLVNPDPRAGQISSLRCALDAVPEADGVVITLVDQGRVAGSTVGAVRSALHQADVAVARCAGEPGHPTGFTRGVFEWLRSPLADPGARAVVEKLRLEGRLVWVDVDDPGVTRNINTPDQYEAFLRDCGLTPRP